MKESQKTVNPKDNVENLFHAAVAGDEHLEVMDIDGCLAYYDGCNNYTRVYYYDDTAETVTKRIIMDEQVSQFLDRESLATFLVKKADHNAIMVMEKLAFIWDEDENTSPARKAMEDEYGDEYALFVAEDSLLGQLWVDRQIPVINVSAIMDSCMEIHDPVLDGPFGIFFTEALLQTIYHELRHLFYECNELIETGSREYPADGGMEENVEEYADAQAAGDLVDFFTLISEKEVRHLKEGMTACRTKEVRPPFE